ncbi:MAG TPA: riboflavin synthase [Sphingomonadales bacterium]|nr:riboflavin synthase [Sphingomonadales bacterium]
MFTGIVTATGTVRALKKSKGARLTLTVPKRFYRAAIGASISVSGVCLTLAAKGRGALSFDLSPETLKRTTLGLLKMGDAVNLERPLRLGDEFGGHIVMGHVDAAGRVKALHKAKGGTKAVISLPKGLAPLVAEKGSIAVDGVSLTVNRVTRGGFEVMLIPHTLYTTALKGLKAGARVNLEADVMARHAKRAKDLLRRQ